MKIKADKIEIKDNKISINGKFCPRNDIIMLNVGKTSGENENFYLRFLLTFDRTIEMQGNKAEILKIYEKLSKFIKNGTFYRHSFADLKYILVNMEQVQDVALNSADGKNPIMILYFDNSTKMINNNARERFNAYKAQHKQHLNYVQDTREFRNIMDKMYSSDEPIIFG